MFTTGFSDTDTLGHINNSKFPILFENARGPIFKIVTPDLDPQKWKLILAKIEVEFVAQSFYGRDIEVRSYISRIDGSSFVVTQEAYQDEVMVARGLATLVYFDYQNQKSMALEGHLREELNKHLV
ncbi:acyl-CoA thioesterase [bacterium AH-315-O15]|nr:acyl-CoA thioesterase [bacterium AH-315-O15]